MNLLELQEVRLKHKPFRHPVLAFLFGLLVLSLAVFFLVQAVRTGHIWNLQVWNRLQVGGYTSLGIGSALYGFFALRELHKSLSGPTIRIRSNGHCRDYHLPRTDPARLSNVIHRVHHRIKALRTPP